MHTILDLKQGTGAWQAHRQSCLNASEAPAVMGASKFTSRSALLKQKATGIEPEHDAATLRRFAAGHEAEIHVRNAIERITGQDFYPVTAVRDIDGLHLSASYDGLTMEESTALEAKLWSESLAAQVRSGELEPHYYWQLEQQILVVGCQKVIFCTGDEDHLEIMEYFPVPGRAEQLIAAWRQFQIDLAAYVPPTIKAEAVGHTPETLPALRIEVTGMVTASNLDAYRSHALAVIKGINRELSTDQHFADATAAVKWCQSVEERVVAAKQHAQSQAETIDNLFRALDDIAAEARTARLQLDKLVTARKEQIRSEIVADGIKAMADHLAALNARLGKPLMPAVPVDFAGAIKGKRTMESLRDAVGTELARAKIEASATADRIQTNFSTLRELAGSHAFLFADTATIVLKAADDFKVLVDSRIAAHKVEAQRQADALAEKAREAIRAEEAAKLVKEQAERIALEKKEALAQLIPAQAAPEIVAPVTAIAPTLAGNVVALPVRTAPPVDTDATIKLGEINALLAPIALTADGLTLLGFPFVATDKNAKLYRISDLGHICAALVAHIETVQAKQAA